MKRSKVLGFAATSLGICLLVSALWRPTECDRAKLLNADLHALRQINNAALSTSAAAVASASPPPSEAATDEQGAWWQAPEPRYGAVFFDPRPHEALVWLVLDTMSKLPPTWRGLVFYSAKNRELVTTGLRAWEAMGRLTLVPFPGPAGSSPDFVFTRDFANSMMLNADFYRALPFDKFLLVQVRVPSALNGASGC